ncbi:unnamed protein product, partial [Porites lobata]
GTELGKGHSRHVWQWPRIMQTIIITPYVHNMIYHVPQMMKKHGSLRKFSGKGVETKNDDPRRYFQRKSNRWDAVTNLLVAEKLQKEVLGQEWVKRGNSRHTVYYATTAYLYLIFTSVYIATTVSVEEKVLQGLQGLKRLLAKFTVMGSYGNIVPITVQGHYFEKRVLKRSHLTEKVELKVTLTTIVVNVVCLLSLMALLHGLRETQGMVIYQVFSIYFHDFEYNWFG